MQHIASNCYQYVVEYKVFVKKSTTFNSPFPSLTLLL